MSHTIEIRRMVTGVESCIVVVDDDTLERIRDKTIDRMELSDLMDTMYLELDVDVLENEEPHTVNIIHRGDSPETICFDGEPDV